MNKAKLLKLIQDLPENAEIIISVDVSTGDNTAFDRIFIEDIHVLELQENRKDRHYSLLATGSMNFIVGK